MIRIKDLITVIEKVAPLSYQESYDNSGLLVGDELAEIKGVVLSLDVTEAVVEEAIQKKCNVIIAHHPIIFSGLKRITGSTYVERTIIKAIQNNIAIYACHTNLDNVKQGVNRKIAEKLGLINLHILSPKSHELQKLVTYVPESHHENVLHALFTAGAGKIGNYDQCSFNTIGTGTFRGNEESKPFIGKPNELSKEKEIRIECIFTKADQKKLMKALLGAHPYEEVAYDVYSLDNKHPEVGSGMWGEFKEELEEKEFLKLVKTAFQVSSLKHTAFLGKKIKKVAFCGGSGRFLLKNAIAVQADAYISADFKYHEYFDADKQLLLADIGHYESEQFTPEIFYDIIKKNFTTFAIHLSKINTNPINYF